MFVSDILLESSLSTFQEKGGKAACKWGAGLKRGGLSFLCILYFSILFLLPGLPLNLVFFGQKETALDWVRMCGYKIYTGELNVCLLVCFWVT